MLNRLPMLLTSVAIGIVFAAAALVVVGSEAKARSVVAIPSSSPLEMGPSNMKIQSVMRRLDSVEKPTEDQVASAITAVRAMMKNQELQNGADYLVAAKIVARGSSEEEALLAHDLAVCAMALGDYRAKEWVAYSQDQFLVRTGNKQRYGTQSKSGKVLPTAAEVPDSVRFILGVPSLLEAQRKVESGKAYDPTKSISTSPAPIQESAL